jgi:hypothetical protein
MTDAKVFTPTRVPQGCCDAALHFQLTMENCFRKLLYKHLLIWIDDLLLYANNVDTYLEKLEELFSLRNDFGLKLSAAKSSLFQRSVKGAERLSMEMVFAMTRNELLPYVRCHCQRLLQNYNSSCVHATGCVTV